MKEVYLKVTKSLPDDFGRGIARIDPPAFPELKLSQGDVIEIAGKRTTVAMAMGAEGKNADMERIRIDGFIRQNADVDIGEQVKVRKVQVRIADFISFAPLEGTAIQFNDNIVDKIKAQLKNRPIVKGDAVPLMSGSNPFLSGVQPNLAVTLIAVAINPPGPVMITDHTEIDIRYRPVKLSDKDEQLDEYQGLREEAKKLRDLIDLQLRQPELFQHVGVKSSHGILLHGASYAGKQLAEAVISGSSYPVFNVSGLDLISKYWGQSEEKLTEIFKDADEHLPSIILVENMDAIAPRRKHDMSDEERKLLARFITLLDDLDDHIVVIGLVNNAYDLDPSLRAGGRFELEIEMKVPDEDGRLDLLQMYTRSMPLDDVDLERIAKDTEDFQERDLEAVVQKAALNALFRSIPPGSLDKPLPDIKVNKIRVNSEDFSAALEDAYKRKSDSFKKLIDPRKNSKGFDVDKQRYSESITEVQK